MKTRIAAIVVLLMIILSPCCLAQVLPDLQYSLKVSGDRQFTDYAYSDDYICDVWVYARNGQSDAAIGEWLLECIEDGFAIQKQTVDGFSAYRAQDEQGLYALLFPDYDGAVMLMVQQNLRYAPDEPAPTSPPAQQGGTDAPTGGHWENVLVEQDCPSCAGGSCSICNGTGVYRLYGESVFCPRECSSCDGLGFYITTQMIYVFD